MKITTLKDINLSKYKLADFYGYAMDHKFRHEQMMEMAEKEIAEDEVPVLTIALIPKSERLTDCNGDDWDDEPANCNASGFYEYPKGTIFLRGTLGQELKLTEAQDE